ncbi:MAG TPA: PilN domain-containing protein [Planctomycetota bacterium]|nr:PilN domain-containing protein [Planctomycetota bacterium]
MIEVNLLPGASKKSKGRGRSAKSAGKGLSLSLPKLPGVSGRMPTPDRMTLAIVASCIIGPLIIAWLFLGARSEKARVSEEIEVAVEDSTRYAKLIAASAKLQARRDTIAQKLSIIQQIDAVRYVWPHVMDEVSRALPEYTWLTRVGQLDTGADRIAIEIRGQTGNNFALTRFLTDLEQSPFLRNVTLQNMDQARIREDSDQLVYDFIIEANYEVPPPDVIQTVPIFGAEGD